MSQAMFPRRISLTEVYSSGVITSSYNIPKESGEGTKCSSDGDSAIAEAPIAVYTDSDIMAVAGGGAVVGVDGQGSSGERGTRIARRDRKRVE